MVCLGLEPGAQTNPLSYGATFLHFVKNNFKGNQTLKRTQSIQSLDNASNLIFRYIIFDTPTSPFWMGRYCLKTVWPDWTIYRTLDDFLKIWATIYLPKSPTFLGNFCKRVKIYHFSSEIIFVQLL